MLWAPVLACPRPSAAKARPPLTCRAPRCTLPRMRVAWALPRHFQCGNCSWACVWLSKPLRDDGGGLAAFVVLFIWREIPVDRQSSASYRDLASRMSAASQPTSTVTQLSGAQAAVAMLLRCGISCGFGIPSIHNIALYDVLRQSPEFHHWVVRHEQAAGFAADGFYRHSGQPAVIFASTGPGNLFTLVPLLESLQTNTPVLLIGTTIASSLLGKTGGAIHETPQQLDIIRPLTRFAHRVASPDAIPGALADAIEVLRGPAPGPAFVEIPHDFLLAPASATLPPANGPSKAAEISSQKDIALAAEQVRLSRRPVVLVGSGVHKSAGAVQKTAEALQAPVFATTSG